MNIAHYSKLTGNFRTISGGDANNDNLPDVLSYSGSGYIICSSKEVRIIDSTTSSVIVPGKINVTVGPEGTLYFDNQPFVYLLAPGNHTNPPNFHYTLRLRLQLGNYETRYSNTFVVNPGAQDDLANVLTVEETPSKLVTAGPAGLSMYELAVKNGQFTGSEAQFIEQFMNNNSSTVTLTPDPDNEGFFKTA